MIVSADGAKVNKLIQKLNKNLGIPKKSKALWDVSKIPTNTEDIANLETRVDALDSKYICFYITISISVCPYRVPASYL